MAVTAPVRDIKDTAAGAMREYERTVSYLSSTLKNPNATRGFSKEFMRQVDLVRENPEPHALSRMPELTAKDYGALFVKNYVVLYKIVDGSVVIAHIFHQSQDYARLV